MTSPSNIQPVILCGGSGTRLWPLSRKSYPKQFSRLIGEKSLFQASAERVSGGSFQPPLVVTGEAFRFIVTEQLANSELSPAGLLIEPEGRNTAPAVLAAALWLEERHPDAPMLVMPSDHVIADDAAFRDTVQAATAAANDGQFVTFGIKPTAPETGYGYLELAGGGCATDTGPQKLARFVEKPGLDAARDMIADGRHLWNSGIFMFSVAAIIDAYKTKLPELFESVSVAMQAASFDLGFTRPDPAAWAAVADISIDYAIMEKADNLVTMPYAGAWSDLGSWEAVRKESRPDENGVATFGPATAIDCQDTLLRSESEGLQIVGIGLKDVIAIAMPDAVLVARQSESQRVREAVEVLKAKGVEQAEALPRDYRPWGWYERLVIGGRFQVKRILVHPGAALSLQSHMHRAEHWIVVQGSARVTVDETVRIVTENESVYIPLGARHRLENPGKVAMVLIEIQTGSYLQEDDIIRYEDVYARS